MTAMSTPRGWLGAGLVALLGSLAPTPGRCAPLTLEALGQRHGKITALSADVEQTKEGRFWARPMRSVIRLSYTPERIVWETVEPIPSTVTIDGDRIRVAGAGAATPDLGALARDPRFAALLRFIRALVSLDFASIEKDFTIRIDERTLFAVPRPGSTLTFFSEVRIAFDADGDLHSMELSAANERTRLDFSNITTTGGPPTAPAPAP